MITKVQMFQSSYTQFYKVLSIIILNNKLFIFIVIQLYAI